MWANPQRDGRHVVYRWRPLFNSALWLCNNAAKTRNPLKFAGVPQTNETISAASGPNSVHYVVRTYEEDKKEDRKKPQGKNIMSASTTQVGHKKV